MAQIKTSELADTLKPYIIRWIEEAGLRTGSTATAGSGIAAHDIGGSYHTGTLRTAQAPWALLTDGTRNLTGNLGVDAGITVDGVDISDHVADPDAHHARSHSIISANDHTVTGSQWALVGLPSANTVGLITPTSDPGSATGILRTDSSGSLRLRLAEIYERLRTPLIDTASGNLTLSPASYLLLSPAGGLVRATSGVSVGSDNYASQSTGWRVDYAGGADFRYLFTDELHAKSFIADLEMALAGGQIVSKSVAILSQTFTAPSAGGATTLRVRDLPSAENMAVFQSGDIVRIRSFSRSGGSLTIADCWGAVTGYVDGPGAKEQSWTFTRSAAPNSGAMAAATTVAPDAVILDYGVSGNGIFETTAVDGAYGLNSPYWQIATWTGHPATGQTVNVRGGNLRGIFGVAGEFGLYAGTGTATSSKYIRLSTVGQELQNLDLSLYSSGTKVATLDNSKGLSFLQSTNANIWMSDPRFITWSSALPTTSTNVIGYLGSSLYSGEHLTQLVTRGQVAGRTARTYLDVISLNTDGVTGDTASLRLSSVNGLTGYAQLLADVVTIGTAGIGSTTIQNFLSIGYSAEVVSGYNLRFPHASQTDTNDGKIGAGLFASGLNIIGVQTGTGLGRQVRIWGDLLTSGGSVYWHSGNNLPADTLDGYHAASFALLSGATFSGSVVSPNLMVSGASSALYIYDRDGDGQYHHIYHSGSVLYDYNGTYGNILSVSYDGTLWARTLVRAGGTSDLYNAAIQAHGNVHATGAVTGQTYLQVAAASTPATANGWARIFLRSSDNALCVVMPSGAVRTLATS